MEKFITYISLYNDYNEKMKNVGFAKFLMQQNRCQMEIHIKGCNYLNQECGVYLFFRDGEHMNGVEVGRINVMNEKGDFKRMIDLSELTQNRLALKQMEGFVIFSKEHQMLASQWVDGEICQERFLVWGEKAPEEIIEKEQIAEPDILQKKMPDEQDGELKAAQKINQDVTVEDIAEPEPQNIHTAELGQARQPVPQSGNQQQAEQELQNENRQQVEPVSQSGNQQQAEQELQDENRQRVEQEQRNKNRQMGESAQRQEWRQIWMQYEVQQPFEGHPEISCVQMQLRDIRQLPREYWYLGNNNFLLHGFFNYGYLLFGRIENPESTDPAEREKWFLGVPGVFQNQERVVAIIFGFPEFVADREETKTGRRGCWFNYLNLTD